MKGRSSTKQGGTKGEMEVDKEGTHLSGAYIRSLVKQLTSSRTTKDPNLAVQGDGFPPSRYHNFGDGQASVSEEGMPVPPLQPPPQQPKKQVRRRLHTTRPYQERLLNMAEARREIVTALKFHRASMKHQSNEHQQPPPSQQLQPPPPPPPQEGKATKCRRNPRIYPSNNSNFNSNYCSMPNSNYPWLASQIPPPPTPENFDLSLPHQTLGLNLNFQDFNNLDATLYHSSSNPSSIYSSSISPSSSSSISNPSPTNNTSSITINHEVPSGTSPGGGLGLHHAIDDEEMEEIRWIGEQHEMEWNDTMNLVTSAWWFKFLKTTEFGAEERQKDEDDAYYPFEEVMEFPAWLNANESCMQQHCFSEPLDDLMEDAALPCMDIGEIEGMDGEWWA